MIEWALLGSILIGAFKLVYALVVSFTIAMVVLDNRHPVRTLAWVLVLFYLPFIGLVFYFFFGRSTRRQRLIGYKTVSSLYKRPREKYLAQEALSPTAINSPVMAFFRKVSRALPFDGNAIRLHTSGYEMLHDMLRDIAAARHHIHLEFYIFEDDAVGRLVRDALLDKVKEGVEVRLLYDDVGSWHVRNSFFEEMRRQGLEAEAFLKVRFPQFTAKVNYRNHRKQVIIDGRIGYIGGMNIALRYMKGVSWGVWRDTHMRVEGKAVYGLQTAFLLDWYVVTQRLITNAVYFPEVQSHGQSLMQIVTGDPVGEWRDIMQGMLLALCNAKKYFYIETPYLLPTDPIIVALRTAALAGVDVRVMIPERGDARIIHLGTLSYLEDLMRAGVKVYMYRRGFLHSKLMVSDDGFSTVGSTNVDFRSFEHNFEINAFMYDTRTARTLKQLFLRDQKDCRLLNEKEWAKRSMHQKVQESVVRLLAPLL
jgi:cardiolipin synthase